jgi:hypothetical protein
MNYYRRTALVALRVVSLAGVGPRPVTRGVSLPHSEALSICASAMTSGLKCSAAISLYLLGDSDHVAAVSRRRCAIASAQCAQAIPAR